MIVTTGKTVIIDFFGGQVGRIADTIAFGTGTTAPTLDDTALGAESVRIPLSSIGADTANSRIVFKALLQPGLIDTIYELGIFSDGSVDGGTLVARVVLATPWTVDATIPTEVEYSLGLSV